MHDYSRKVNNFAGPVKRENDIGEVVEKFAIYYEYTKTDELSKVVELDCRTLKPIKDRQFKTLQYAKNLYFCGDSFVICGNFTSDEAQLKLVDINNTSAKNKKDNGQLVVCNILKNVFHCTPEVDGLRVIDNTGWHFFEQVEEYVADTVEAFCDENNDDPAATLLKAYELLLKKNPQADKIVSDLSK